MKHFIYIKLLILGSFLSMFFYGCFNSNELSIKKIVSSISNTENKLVFKKSNDFEWAEKSIKISFENELNNFSLIENFRQKLTLNNIDQGIIVKIKLIDYKNKIEDINEIMIDSQELSRGINEFSIGYKDNTPYIIL